jgi:hypothetical protein
MSKRAGRKSQASNDFLEPKAPINVSGSNVGTNRAFNDGAASVSFELPADSPSATSFTVVAYKSGIEDTTATNLVGGSSPIVVGGLDSAASYTFKVSATNAAGTSALSTESGSVTITTVPATPNAPTVQNFSGDQTDYVSWSAPATGGATLSTYYWESTDSKSGNTTGTSANVAQEADTSQQYRVRVTNANGTSAWSDYSTSNTTPPFFPPYFPFFPPFFPYFPFFPFFPFFPPYFPYFPFFPFFPYFPFFPFFPFFPPSFPFFPPRFMRIL